VKSRLTKEKTEESSASAVCWKRGGKKKCEPSRQATCLDVDKGKAMASQTPGEKASSRGSKEKRKRANRGNREGSDTLGYGPTRRQGKQTEGPGEGSRRFLGRNWKGTTHRSSEGEKNGSKDFSRMKGSLHQTRTRVKGGVSVNGEQK